MTYFCLKGFQFRIDHVDNGLLVSQNTSSRYFFSEQPSEGAVYATCFYLTDMKQFPQGAKLLEGNAWEGVDMAYSWQIVQLDKGVGVLISFKGNTCLRTAMVEVDLVAHTVSYYLQPVSLPCNIDLYENPMGVLLTIILANCHNGLVIHASGVNDNGRGYLFTGVSGIGKSTMARLWQTEGAQIVNDDRLMVMPNSFGYVIANTPMPYYDDVPKYAQLKGIFLLSQAKSNSLVQLKGATAVAKVMANCMQHLHSKYYIANHLGIIQSISCNIPVFELAFKPDGDIVTLIRSLNV